MMTGFRRAQLRGSEELFRSTDEPKPVSDELAIAVDDASSAPAPANREHAHPVPNIPAHDQRTVRLTGDELNILADALQHLKFPNKQPARPSVDDFEALEELRQKLLNAR